MLDILF